MPSVWPFSPAERRRPTRQRALLIEAGVVLAVVVVLVLQAIHEFGHRSLGGYVLAALAICAAWVLCVVAWRLAVQVKDMTARVADSARRLAGAEQTGQELIWEMRPDSTVTYMSGIARSMFGVDPSEIVGQSVFVLLPEHEQQRARAVLDRCVRERRGWSGLQVETLHADGVLRWVETTSVARLDDAGNLRGFTATTRRLPADDVQRIEHERVRDRIQAMLTSGSLRTVVQPIFNVQTTYAVGYEALTRFDAEPAQPPDRWFSDAESVGLVVELDCLAFTAALNAGRQLPPTAYLSINVTPATLQSGQLVGLINAAAIPADRIVVEITEHASVADYQALRAPMAALRAMGVRFAVDDAGSGYASFRHILQLRPEIIKLDRELVHDLHRDPARRALASAVVTFAREVGATVTAEGVENENQLEVIAGLGIDTAQGYLLGRPTEKPTQRGRTVPLG